MKKQVFEWHKAFNEGREVVENLPHVSRPFTSVNDDSIEKVREIALQNSRVGIRKIEEALDIAYGSTQHVLVDVSDCQTGTKRTGFLAKRSSNRGRNTDACHRS